MHSIQHRPAFVEAHPELKEAHRAAQCAMFGAAKTAGLPLGPEAKDDMIEGINDALGRKGSRRLISRKQLKIEEMQALTVAIEAGMFGDNWAWSEEFVVTVRPVTVNVVHFEPVNRERTNREHARYWSQAAPARPIRPSVYSPLR